MIYSFQTHNGNRYDFKLYKIEEAENIFFKNVVYIFIKVRENQKGKKTGNVLYVGETERNICERLSEHKKGKLREAKKYAANYIGIYQVPKGVVPRNIESEILKKYGENLPVLNKQH